MEFTQHTKRPGILLAKRIDGHVALRIGAAAIRADAKGHDLHR